MKYKCSDCKSRINHQRCSECDYDSPRSIGGYEPVPGRLDRFRIYGITSGRIDSTRENKSNEAKEIVENETDIC
jgi:hypothetical protein